MISIIVAIGKNNLIGKNNDLPWHYPEDLKYFKETTLNHKVLMGRTTFESILKRLNKPLPNRTNIVVTSSKTYNYDNVVVINDLDKFLKAKHDEEIFVIGGKQIYQQSMKYADRLYITYVNKDYDGDVFFGEINYSLFELINRKDIGELSFCVFERIKK